MTGGAGTDLRPGRALAERAVRDGLARYFADRRSRVDPFVDRHFSLRGALAIHRAALGLDILRTPVNLTLAAPQIGVRLAGAVAVCDDPVLEPEESAGVEGRSKEA